MYDSEMVLVLVRELEILGEELLEGVVVRVGLFDELELGVGVLEVEIEELELLEGV